MKDGVPADKIEIDIDMNTGKIGESGEDCAYGSWIYPFSSSSSCLLDPIELPSSMSGPPSRSPFTSSMPSTTLSIWLSTKTQGRD